MAVPILVIGEDPALLAVMERALSDTGYDAYVQQAGDMGCWWNQDPFPSAVVLDVQPQRPAPALYALLSGQVVGKRRLKRRPLGAVVAY
jgi:DNA-binding NtrC family response regulator